MVEDQFISNILRSIYSGQRVQNERSKLGLTHDGVDKSIADLLSNLQHDRKLDVRKALTEILRFFDARMRQIDPLIEVCPDLMATYVNLENEYDYTKKVMQCLN